MKKYFLWVVLLCIGIVFSNAQNTKGADAGVVSTNNSIKGKTYALICGISKYQSPTTYKSLNYADDDAREFYKYLTSVSGGKVDPNNIDTLINEHATMGEFWNRFNGIKERAVPGDMVYIYFSGHGDAYRADLAFLLAYDAPAGKGSKEKNHYLTGMGLINIHTLKVVISELTEQKVNVMLITDACRTNEMPGGAEGQRVAYEQIFEKSAGEIQLMSCSSNQVSFEGPQWGNGRGLFSWHLINGLKGMADVEPENGKVTLGELYDYVKRSVNRATYDTISESYRQTPAYCCKGNDALVISLVNAEEKKKLWNQLHNGTKYNEDNALLSANKGVDLGTQMKEIGMGDIYEKFEEAVNNDNLIDSSGAYDILQIMLDDKRLTPTLASQLKSELSSMLMTDVAKVINTYLNASQNNNLYTYDYFHTAYLKLKKFESIANPAYFNAIDIKVNLLFLEGHQNWQSHKSFEIQYCLDKIDSAIQIKPDAAYLYNIQGILLTYLNKVDDAKVAYQKGMELAPNWLYPTHNLGFYYMNKGIWDSADYYLRKAVQLDSNFQNSWGGIGVLKWYMGDTDSSLFYVNIALKKDPKDPTLHMFKGYRMIDYDSIPEAKKHFYTAIRYDKKQTHAYAGLTQIYLENDPNGDSAMYYINQMIAADSTDPRSYLSVADMLFKNDLDTLAKEFYNYTIYFDSLTAEAWYGLAKVYEKWYDYTTAEAAYNEAIKINPFYYQAMNELGLMYYNQGDYDKTLPLMYKLVEMMPTIAVYKYNYAYISYVKGDNATAETYYKECIKTDPKYTDAYFELGRIYALQQNAEACIEQLENYLQYKPEYKKSDFLLDTDYKNLSKNNSQFKKWVKKKN